MSWYKAFDMTNTKDAPLHQLHSLMFVPCRFSAMASEYSFTFYAAGKKCCHIAKSIEIELRHLHEVLPSLNQSRLLMCMPCES